MATDDSVRGSWTASVLRVVGTAFVGLVVALVGSACSSEDEPGTPRKPLHVLRLGHFPNVTHVHGLVAHALAKRGEGFLEQRIGADIKVEYLVFNAGPAAMEALLAGSIDAAYVGPNPAINAHVRTGGKDVRVLAGATRGGSGLVVRKDAGIRTANDLRGRRIGTPQLGNTQDVACRAWLAAAGLRITQSGGDAFVVPTENADLLTLFRGGKLDAAWTIEPWLSRLELEADGELLVDDRDAITTVLVGSQTFLIKNGHVAARLVRAHYALTEWITSHPERAKVLVAEALEDLTKARISRDLVDRCWQRMRFDAAITSGDFLPFVKAAKAAGLMKETPDLLRLVHSR